ncbi:MAG: cytochrome c-type biogenesis protein CcmH [Acidobacteria bacterium]|nr:cytochrome c-type biogenesis protein CcmH [Acidobacteriota bacterium]
MLFLACLASAQSAKSDLTDPAQAARFQKITKSLICQCGCQMGLADCNHVGCPSAIPLRKEVEMRIRNGESDDAIIKVMVDRFGPVILAAPTGKGFDITAWVTPFVMIAIGLLVIYFFLRTQRRSATATGSPAQPDSDQDQVRVRIEDELRARERE